MPDQLLRCAGYVKLAKLWERKRDEAIEYHNAYYINKVEELENMELVDVFIDITGKKEIRNRSGMLRLLKSIKEGEVNCILTQTKAYLAANGREFCFLWKYLTEICPEINVVTEDLNYQINTIERQEDKESLVRMANSYIALMPEEYTVWKKKVETAIDKI